MKGVVGMAVSRRELVKVAGAAMMAGAGLRWAPPAQADEADDEMLAARFQKIFGRYCINDTLSAEDAAFVEQYAIPADSDQARGTYILDTQDTYEGHPCRISGNWYHADYPKDERWHVYGATIQAEYPDGVAEEIIIGMRFMAFGHKGSSSEPIWKEEQSDGEENISLRSTEFAGEYMGDLTHLAVSCFAMLKSQSHLLAPCMVGAPYTLASAGTYSTSEIPVERHLRLFSPE